MAIGLLVDDERRHLGHRLVELLDFQALGNRRVFEILEQRLPIASGPTIDLTSSRGLVIYAPSATTAPTATKTTVRMDSFIGQVQGSGFSRKVTDRSREMAVRRLNSEPWTLNPPAASWQLVATNAFAFARRLRVRECAGGPRRPGRPSSGKMGGNTVACSLYSF